MSAVLFVKDRQQDADVEIPMIEAIAVLRDATVAGERQRWPDDLSILDPPVFEHTRLHGHRQITDAYLLALAVHHNGRFVTFDRPIPL